MSEIDSIIESLGASIDALKKASSVAEEANVPEEDRANLARAQETLQAMSDRMYSLAMSQGLTRNITRSKRYRLKDGERKDKELKDKELKDIELKGTGQQ